MKKNKGLKVDKRLEIKSKVFGLKKIIKKNSSKKFDYRTLTVREIEEELNKEKYNEKYLKILRNTIYSLIIIVSVAIIIGSLIMPVLEINGSHMEPTYRNGDIVVSIKTKNLSAGDIIAFYHGNKILIKRVIAGSGDYVNIDDDGIVYVNGEMLSEPYVTNKELGKTNIEFPYQVPDGQWFVLSDERDNLIDSRNNEVGCISQKDIIGKILFRIWPLTK